MRWMTGLTEERAVEICNERGKIRLQK